MPKYRVYFQVTGELTITAKSKEEAIDSTRLVTQRELVEDGDLVFGMPVLIGPERQIDKPRRRAS